MGRVGDKLNPPQPSGATTVHLDYSSGTSISAYTPGGSSYLAVNSAWGAGSAGSYHWWEDIIVDCASFPNNVTFNWNWPATPYTVYGYPFVGVGEYSSSWPNKPAILLIPRQLNAIQSCIAHHDFTFSATSGTVNDFDVIYDFYLTATPHGTGDATTGKNVGGLWEVSIWCHTPTIDGTTSQHDVQAWLTQSVWLSTNRKGTITDADGLTWCICHLATDNAVPDRLMIWPFNFPDVKIKDLDLKLLLQAATTFGITNGREYFNGCHIGVEPDCNAGTFTLNKFQLTNYT